MQFVKSVPPTQASAKGIGKRDVQNFRGPRFKLEECITYARAAQVELLDVNQRMDGRNFCRAVADQLCYAKVTKEATPAAELLATLSNVLSRPGESKRLDQSIFHEDNLLAVVMEDGSTLSSMLQAAAKAEGRTVDADMSWIQQCLEQRDDVESEQRDGPSIVGVLMFACMLHYEVSICVLRPGDELCNLELTIPDAFLLHYLPKHCLTIMYAGNLGYYSTRPIDGNENSVGQTKDLRKAVQVRKTEADEARALVGRKRSLATTTGATPSPRPSKMETLPQVSAARNAASIATTRLDLYATLAQRAIRNESISQQLRFLTFAQNLVAACDADEMKQLETSILKAWDNKSCFGRKWFHFDGYGVTQEPHSKETQAAATRGFGSATEFQIAGLKCAALAKIENAARSNLERMNEGSKFELATHFIQKVGSEHAGGTDYDDHQDTDQEISWLFTTVIKISAGPSSFSVTGLSVA